MQKNTSINSNVLSFWEYKIKKNQLLQYSSTLKVDCLTFLHTQNNLT